MKSRFLARVIASWLAMTVLAPSVLAAPGANCPRELTFKNLNVTSIGSTPAAPATMVLPANGGARILFDASIGTSKDDRGFRAFEVPSLSDLTQGKKVDILDIAPATDAEKTLLRAADGVALTLDIPAKTPPWRRRSFVVVACDGDNLGAWGAVSAPVSHPTVSLAICIVVGLLAYVLGMNAIFANRDKQLANQGFAKKYPAVFGARPLSSRDFFNPIHFATNPFNQGSVQKLQVVVFSFLIAELVLALTLNTGTLTELSPTLIVLLGISGVGAATAQAAYQQKTRLSFDNWAWLSHREFLKIPAPGRGSGPFWRDLVITNREFDVYKLQTIIFSVAVVAAIIVRGSNHLSTFNVPDTLLGVLGLSQVVYVGGVLVKPPANADLDVAITKLRDAGDTLATARTHNTDTDDNGKLMVDATGRFIDVRTTDAAPGANALRQYKALEGPMVDMIESALEVEVNPAALDPM